MKNIPDKAKKVFEGKIFDIYQWEQELFDGSTTTFEAMRRVGTIEVIVVMEDGSIVIAHELQPNMEKPLYSLFSGRMEKGEEPLEAAKRELKEESGLESGDWQLYKEYNSHSNKIDWPIYVFIARNCKKTSETQLEAGEKITPHSCSFDEFIDIALGDEFWSHDFSNDVLRMHYENKLNELEKLLSNNA